ncbi:hypothetical protein SAMN04487895_10681 [Paenibacillus sophorae]|uniref:Uncharacterized protein n=1 Tax=Paenibacillus sophorae TaxID=1333845 RepID=A0A1H8N6K8_9BACL|nr:hypothetical protein SAMN04487895_10681 [Paenibacillus sophorae]
MVVQIEGYKNEIFNVVENMLLDNELTIAQYSSICDDYYHWEDNVSFTLIILFPSPNPRLIIY